MLSHAADPSTHGTSYKHVVPTPGATNRVTATAATIGHYRRLPGAAAARAARMAAARWRMHRGRDDIRDRSRIEARLFSLLESVSRYRRLDAIAADLHDLADHCSAVQARQDAELAAYVDAHEAPPLEEPAG